MEGVSVLVDLGFDTDREDGPVAQDPDKPAEEPIDEQGDEKHHAHHGEDPPRRFGAEQRFEVEPQGDEEQGEQEEGAGEVEGPAAFLLEVLVDEADPLERVGRGFVALADDDFALLDAVEDGLDLALRPLPPGLAVHPVVGDVGGEEEIAEPLEDPLLPAGDLEPGDFSPELVPALLEFQDVVHPDDALVPRAAEEGEPPFGLAADEQALGNDDAPGRDLADEADERVLQLGRELFSGQRFQVAGGDLQAVLLHELLLELGDVLPRGRMPQPGLTGLEDLADPLLGVKESVFVEDIDGEDGLGGLPLPGGRGDAVLDGQVDGRDKVRPGDFPHLDGGQCPRRRVGHEIGQDEDERRHLEEWVLGDLTPRREVLLVGLRLRAVLGRARRRPLEELQALERNEVHASLTALDSARS